MSSMYITEEQLHIIRQNITGNHNSRTLRCWFPMGIGKLAAAHGSNRLLLIFTFNYPENWKKIFFFEYIFWHKYFLEFLERKILFTIFYYLYYICCYKSLSPSISVGDKRLKFSYKISILINFRFNNLHFTSFLPYLLLFSFLILFRVILALSLSLFLLYNFAPFYRQFVIFYEFNFSEV